MYVRKFFHQDSKLAVLEMINAILNETKFTLNESQWMDEEVQQYLLNKLEPLNLDIGYPDELLDDSKIEEYYEQLEVDENNYLRSVMSVFKWENDNDFIKLRDPITIDWRLNLLPTIMQGAYNGDENRLR